MLKLTIRQRQAHCPSQKRKNRILMYRCHRARQGEHRSKTAIQSPLLRQHSGWLRLLIAACREIVGRALNPGLAARQRLELLK